MSSKRQKLDIPPTEDEYISDDDVAITTYAPMVDRCQQVCASCHKTRAGTAVQVGSKRVMIAHSKVCEGKCTNVKCNHRSHSSRKKRTMTAQQKRAALMAGFKPQEDIEFKSVLQRKLQQAGLESDILPGPAQLSLVIEACKEYTSTNRSHTDTISQPRHSSSTSTPTSTSLNSVVHLLESTDRSVISASRSSPSPTSTSTPTKKKGISNKFQCNHCSFVYDDDNGVVSNGSKCFMCEHGKVDVARVGATMSPLVFRSAMDLLDHHTSTSSSTSIPKEKRAHVPDTWPPGKNCDVCHKIIAIKYCTTCMSYLCGSSNCMKWLHDPTDAGQHGCDEGDLIVINLTTGTRSGKAYTPTSTSTSTSTSKSPSTATSTTSASKSPSTISTTSTSSTAISTSTSTPPIPTPKSISISASTSTSTSINDDMPELEHDDIEIEDLTCPTLLPLLKQRHDRATQTETVKVDVQVQTNYNMAFKPLASNNTTEIHLPSASASALPTKPKLSIPFNSKKTLQHKQPHVRVNDKENSVLSANNVVAVE